MKIVDRYNLSNVVGATGARIQALFVLALKDICKHGEYKHQTMSYLFDATVCEQLKQGMEHPLKLTARATFTPWMDDIWDRHMYEKQDANYYCTAIGMSALECRRISMKIPS